MSVALPSREIMLNDENIQSIRDYLKKNVREEINHKAEEYTNVVIVKILEIMRGWHSHVMEKVSSKLFCCSLTVHSKIDLEILQLIQGIYTNLFDLSITKPTSNGRTSSVHFLLPDILPNIEVQSYAFQIFWTPENPYLYGALPKRFKGNDSNALGALLYASRKETGDVVFQKTESDIEIYAHSLVLGQMSSKFLIMMKETDREMPTRIPFQCSPEVIENIVYFTYHRNLLPAVEKDLEILLNLYKESKNWEVENPMIQDLTNCTFDLIQHIVLTQKLDHVLIINVLMLAQFYNEQALILPCLNDAEIIESSTPMDWSSLTSMYPKLYELAMRNYLPKLTQRFQHLMEVALSTTAAPSTSSHVFF